MSEQKISKYVDLKINGKMFPSWIMKNFKAFQLPPLLKKGMVDPCAPTESEIKGARKELKINQRFLSSFLSYNSIYKSHLVYFSTGVGKSATVLSVYNSLFNYNHGWNVFLLLKSSLRINWLDEIKKWLQKDEYEYRFKNIIFLHYDSPTADKQFLDAMKNIDSSKKSMYIIEESHNFIRNVYSNISGGGRRAQVIYDYIIQDKKENPDTRIILLSGTPAINNPFELALMFNLLRPGIFPRSEADFNHQFISGSAYRTLNPMAKNLFQRRILGLVSYYIGSTPDLYATKTIHFVDVPMSDYQRDIYGFFEEIETKMALKAAGRKGASSTYKSYTRQACNFVFPAISQTVSGENRPRPNKFRLSERDAIKLSEGREDKETLKEGKEKDKILNVTEYLKVINLYIKTFDDYLNKNDKDDINKKYTIINDVEKFITKYDGDFGKFNIEEKQKSNLYNAMYISSPKFLNIIFNIMKSRGPVIVYSNYVLMEGLEVFKIYLKYFGFYNYMDKYEFQQDKIGYVEFHGGIKDIADRYRGRDAFNKPENKNGTLIKIILISPAGSEGLSLMNVRQIHIIEPYWNEVRIQQIIGRGIRQCSHALLSLEDRHVDVYRYKSIRANSTKWTTDQQIEDIARSKESLIQSFLDAMKEAAVDCNLFKTHNMLNDEYKCFQFDEPSLFDKHIGPAYKEDIADDVKMDNGSNSLRSMTLKIKVMKVKAVKLLSSPDEPVPRYSKSEFYWYYAKSGVVYDYDLHYAIGRVAIDDQNLPIKINSDTYLIDYVIPIPTIEEQ